jgi:hypothetical protein
MVEHLTALPVGPTAAILPSYDLGQLIAAGVVV